MVANGPSLNDLDLSFLRKETVIGMNKIFLGLSRFRFYPQYYVAVNMKVLRQSITHIAQLNCLRFIDARAKDTGLLADCPLTVFIRENTLVPFSTRLDDGYHQGHTVTYVALQVAFHLGFTKVVILGLDHRYVFNGRPGEASVLRGPDPNHFSPDYFGHGQDWDNPELEASEAYYRIAREAYEKAGRRIVDATPGGSCPVFVKEDYREALGL